MSKQKVIKKNNIEHYFDFYKKAYGVDLIKDTDKYLKDNDIILDEQINSDNFYKLLFKSIFPKPVVSYVMSSGNPNIFYQFTNTMKHVIKFNQLKKVYNIKSDLIYKLYFTNIKNVDTHFIKMPFNSIYLNLESNNVLTFYDNLNKRTVDIKGISLSIIEDENFRFGDTTSEMKKEYSDKDMSAFKGTSKMLQVLLTPEITGTDLKEFDDFIYFLNIPFEPSGSVESQLEEYLSFFIQEQDKQTIPDIHRIMKFIINTLFYINSSKPDMDFVDIEKVHRKARNKKSTNMSYYNVGSNITIDRKFVESAMKDKKNKSIKNYKALHWIVGGHWRNQAYGENRTLRKLKWIEPYEKGKDLSQEISSKEYNVK